MSETKIEEIKPFKQISFFKENAVLSLNEDEFEAINNVLGIFHNAYEAIQSIFDRNINEGNILIKYIQQDGTEISQLEALEYLKKASEYLKESTSS